MRPLPAHHFTASLGVNTHFPYDKSPYGAQYVGLRDRLRELGVEHVRDGGPVLWNQKPDYMASTWDRLKNQPCDILYVLDAKQKPLALPSKEAYPYVKDYSQTDVPFLGQQLGTKVEAWEGINEPDGKVGAVDWAAKAMAFQKAARTDLPGETLLTPAIGHPWEPAPYASLGFDFWGSGPASFHPYAGTKPPELELTAKLRLLRRYAPDSPIWATECGYDTSSEVRNGVPTGVSEALQARYTLRTVLYHAAMGFERTYLYELCDQSPDKTKREGTLGLLRYDLSPKPAYAALKNLLTLLRDDGPDYPLYELPALDLPAGVYSLVLQKRDGSVWVALWSDTVQPLPDSDPIPSWGIDFYRPDISTVGDEVQGIGPDPLLVRLTPDPALRLVPVR